MKVCFILSILRIIARFKDIFEQLY